MGPAQRQLFLLVLLVGLPAFWFLIFHLMGRLGGWGRLAENYRSYDDMPPTRFRFQTVWVNGRTHYGGSVTLGVDHRGLHLAALGPLLGHPPLFIPWSDISLTPKKVWWMQRADLRFRRTPDVYVRISARLAERLATAAASFGTAGAATLATVSS
jgi:hypothetical protein